MELDAPFIQNGWRYHGEWKAVAVLCAVREGRLPSMLEANPVWARVLKGLSLRRWQAWTDTVRAREEAARLRAVEQNQPWEEL